MSDCSTEAMKPKDKTCCNERFHYAPYEWDSFTCSKCGCTIDPVGTQWCVKGHDGDYEYDAVVQYCPNCGREVNMIDDSWKSKESLEQRYRQLEQVAKGMQKCLAKHA